MYTVQMEHECGCFKRSEYTNNKTFEKREDAHNYSNILIELMNEEFCKKHHFFMQPTHGNEFIIRVTDKVHSGGCASGSCGC
jgi:hypothetical protein